MTHRDFSRNAASSRAIPIKKMLQLVRNNMAVPIHWGAKQAGMQADNQLTGFKRWMARKTWKATGFFVSYMVQFMNALGLHKQVANRMLEPWSHIKVVVTTTKYNNWFTLRDHKDAQPEIRELAVRMRREMYYSIPRELAWGEWHLPYVSDQDRIDYPLSTQIKISTTACAQVSYRVLDTSITKVNRVFDLLINADIIHASPFEHPARATKSGGSGNFTGTAWKQYRFYVERKIEPPTEMRDYTVT
jgi:hypothetical protein